MIIFLRQSRQSWGDFGGMCSFGTESVKRGHTGPDGRLSWQRATRLGCRPALRREAEKQVLCDGQQAHTGALRIGHLEMWASSLEPLRHSYCLRGVGRRRKASCVRWASGWWRIKKMGCLIPNESQPAGFQPTRTAVYQRSCSWYCEEKVKHRLLYRPLCEQVVHTMKHLFESVL